MGGHHSRNSHSQLRSASYSTHHHYHTKVHNSINGDRPFPPLLFHPRTKGSRILIDPSQKTVKRIASFCDGIVFSNRHVAVNEVVRLEITASQPSWQGALRIGFTTEDPSTMSPDRLPKYSCPDLAAKPGFWVKALPDELLHTGNVISFWVNIKGSVFYQGYNGNPKRLLSHLPVWQLLWVLIDVYGQTKGVQFLDRDLYSARAFTAKNTSNFQQRKRGDPLPLSFFGEECHQQCGDHDHVHPDHHPPRYDDCCRRDPSVQLPDRHSEMRLNHPLKVLDADVRHPSPPSSPLPPSVIDMDTSLSHKPRKVYVKQRVSGSALPSHAGSSPQRPPALISPTWTQTRSKHESVYASLSSESNLNTARENLLNSHSSRPSTEAEPEPPAWEECVVCYDEAVDTVLYSCGHMCLCHSCALKLKNGECPICRKKITDVIKTYRSSARR
ncbi:neuralized E3 ubiquitin protein ligase 1Ab [Nerophis lumbriciformis]|uniref:neuralized E3 ubiquitin protein ligase 1Ab n=1 Tax=Nerophis lumbriciformis TaxID=546530 RepID=UPI002ADF12BB|nr:E3 ubiquitin-protein ligase NEURL1-like [Nerophis lumbriciformis]